MRLRGRPTPLAGSWGGGSQRRAPRATANRRRDSLGATVHPLLAEPTSEQKRLLDVIYRGRQLASSETGLRWPIFQYVEHELYRHHGIDAMRAFAGCPTIGGHGSGGQYGWTWSQTRQPADEIGLTVAGMAHLPAAVDEVHLFVAVLRLAVETQRSFEPSPTDVQTITITSQEVKNRLPPSWVSAAALADIPTLLRREPATWHCTARSSDDAWDLELSPFLRSYTNLGTAQEYLERLVELLTPVVPEAPPLHPSPLSLPEAIDYLNAIWRLHAGTALIRIGRAEAAAKLVLDCANADEFESRLSALCSIVAAVDGWRSADRGSARRMTSASCRSRPMSTSPIGIR